MRWVVTYKAKIYLVENTDFQIQIKRHAFFIPLSLVNFDRHVYDVTDCVFKLDL